MIQAEKNVKPAKVGIGKTELLKYSRNRRARISPQYAFLKTQFQVLMKILWIQHSL
jgi:hypothetical protein